MGQGVGQGGQEEGGLARADAAASLCGSTPQVGGGANLPLARPEQEDEQGLREALCERRSVHLRGHDPFDGEAPGPCLRISKQFQKVYSAKFAFTEFSEVRHGPGPLPIGSYCAAQPGYEPAGCLTVTVRRFQKLIRAISMIKAERVGSS
jgi:hypothetical protein